MNKNIVILDDCQSEAEKTRFILCRFFRDIVNSTSWNMVIYTDGKKLINDIEKSEIEPTMIFCDVDMETEEYNGIDIAKKINVLAPQSHIVYLTNYLEYAPDIFQTEHLYFVLKSELEKRLPEIYIKMINKTKEHQKTLRIEGKRNKFIAIKYLDIVYIERKGRTTFIHGKEEEWETYLPLNKLEELIEDNSIIRCHNSFMVSMNYIKKYIRELCTMVNDEKIPISRKYQPIFKEAFVKWSKEQI
ncbi:LytTR family DNA-binding domain-containing protein [Lachnospiraceae bacterium NSJ-171]|nr:LytTR family DNA-binding domain-containing protein [Lachnospiraceae bacterium NSJ-171]